MKSLLVVLSFVGVALAQWGPPNHAGVPADTPEVAAAKAAHLAALARANQAQQPQQQQWAQPQAQQWGQPQPQQWSEPQHQPRWNGPVALPPGFDQNGAPLPVQDTPEVAAERARHLTLYSGGGHPSLVPAQQSWNGAPAQQSWNGAPAQQSWNAPAQRSWNGAPAQSWNSPAAPQWSAPAPQWGAPAQAGLPQDTPEVAAARAAHLAAHAALPPSSNQGRWKRSAILAVPAVSSISAYSTSVVHSAPVVHASPIVATRLLPAPLAISHW